jgi:hypothetical protein
MALSTPNSVAPSFFGEQDFSGEKSRTFKRIELPMRDFFWFREEAKKYFMNVNASMSVENRIQRALDELGIGLVQFCVISGEVSQTRLSQAFNGLRPLPNELGEKLEGVIFELKAIREGAKPIPVDFRNVIAIKEILEQRRTQAAQQK